MDIIINGPMSGLYLSVTW